MPCVSTLFSEPVPMNWLKLHQAANVTWTHNAPGVRTRCALPSHTLPSHTAFQLSSFPKILKCMEELWQFLASAQLAMKPPLHPAEVFLHTSLAENREGAVKICVQLKERPQNSAFAPRNQLVGGRAQVPAFEPLGIWQMLSWVAFPVTLMTVAISTGSVWTLKCCLTLKSPTICLQCILSLWSTAHAVCGTSTRSYFCAGFVTGE